MNNELTWGQRIVLGLAAVPMVGFGILGGWGTYTNIMSSFDRSATAFGVVAAGEGATLVLAMIMIGRTMLGQSSPAIVRLGLWILPAMAAYVGYSTAKTSTEQIVFAVTPMAMCVSAEGLGFLARSIVIYTTGQDMEAQRRNAETLQKIAYHQARSKNHPDERTRNRSAKKVWRIAKRVGVSDDLLGANLIGVQRDRMTQGADVALVSLFSLLSGQDSQDKGQDTDKGQHTTAGQETVSLDTDRAPVRTQSGRTQSKLSVRAYLRGQLENDPGLVKADAKGLAVGQFNDDMTEENFQRSWSRARADLNLSN